MDRKWRTNRAAIATVLSLPQFAERVGAWQDSYKLASLTDLYALYTVLHIENKQWEIKWSDSGGFYYFLATSQIDASKEGVAAAPEGDEDMPQLIPEIEAAELSPDSSPRTHDSSRKQERTRPDVNPLPSDAPSPSGPGNPPPAAEEPSMQSQLILPMSSAYTMLTPSLLQRLFCVKGEAAVQQVILALIDSNGVVTRCSLFNYIQAPLEGPGAARLLLLDD